MQNPAATSNDGGFIVPHPFDADSPGSHDCILMSSEGHQFGVVRYILGIASPIFADMFAIPQGPSDGSSGLPVINMAEDTKTLYALLLLTYPAGIGQVPSLGMDLVRKLLAAHEKYEMPPTRVVELARSLYTGPDDELMKHGLELYGFAWKFDLAEEAKIASQYTHHVRITDNAVAVNLIRWAGGSLEALLALMRLREDREQELEKIIGALDLRSYLCRRHGAGDGNPSPEARAEASMEYHERVKSEKIAIRSLLAAPHPDAGEILWHFNNEQALELWEVEWGNPPCSGCRYKGDEEDGALRRVDTILANYPQRITSFKENPVKTSVRLF